MKRPLKFRLHFNRINMQRGNPAVWTIHTSKQCIQVPRVEVFVPLESHFRPEAPQPRAFFTGRGVIQINGDTARITA